ncbi:hypothetical protein F5887DRAFT_936296 [Amanita rubescens]|nr:hypothetical protein F5887DRAFT_936296 [Amanita rubescens]
MLATLTRASRRNVSSFVRYYSSHPAPETVTEGEETIVQKLTKRFSPSQLKVQDVSGGCGTFYAITIASNAFKGLPTVKQHKVSHRNSQVRDRRHSWPSVKTIPE